jgi:hypothetical protein
VPPVLAANRRCTKPRTGNSLGAFRSSTKPGPVASPEEQATFSGRQRRAGHALDQDKSARDSGTRRHRQPTTNHHGRCADHAANRLHALSRHLVAPRCCSRCRSFRHGDHGYHAPRLGVAPDRTTRALLRPRRSPQLQMFSQYLPLEAEPRHAAVKAIDRLKAYVPIPLPSVRQRAYSIARCWLRSRLIPGCVDISCHRRRNIPI